MGTNIERKCCFQWVLIFAVIIFVSTSALATTYYVDAKQGQDTNTGTSEDAAWKTIAMVNVSSFMPGDQILFKRGGVWREPLTVSASGEPGKPITFGAYGDMNLDECKLTKCKPKLFGSVTKNDAKDWKEYQTNKWEVDYDDTNAAEILPNPSFTNDANSWETYTNTSTAVAQRGRDDKIYYPGSEPASYKIHCTKQGTGQNDIQLYTTPFPLNYGESQQCPVRKLH